MSDHTSTTPEQFRDLYETPYFIANWLDQAFDFDVDLAANEENSICDNYFSEKEDSLKQDWSQYKCGFCNPPYSDIGPWVKKAIEEMSKGFVTVMLVPAPNGESQYAKIFQHASEIMFITGRVSFLAAWDWESKNGKKIEYRKKGQEVSGNTRGTVAVVFEKCDHPIITSHYFRNDLKQQFGE